MGDLERGGVIRSSLQRRWTPWIMPVFILADVVVFIATMYVNNCPAEINCIAAFLGRFSLQPSWENPSLGPSSMTLRKMGALHWEDIVNRHQRWRFITSIFLHAGVIHLAANVWSLIFIAIPFEGEFGFAKTVTVYLLSGFGGSVLSTVFFRATVCVGASSPLYGLLGAMVSDIILNWSMYPHKIALLLMVMLTVVVNLAVTILPLIDIFSHIGGFLTGILLGFILLPQPRSRDRVNQCVLAMLAAILLIFGLFIASVMAIRGVNGYDMSSWCSYLTCLPFTLQCYSN